MKSFEEEVRRRLKRNGSDQALKRTAQNFIDASAKRKYSYNFSWMGRPIIQYPQDIVAVQEIIWEVRPDLVIETGIAHGGSLILSASMLALLELCHLGRKGKVLGVDIDIREHNRAAILAHPMAPRIEMIQGSSIDPEIIRKVHQFAKGFRRVLVFLDSNHTHEHVLAELEAYAPLTSRGSYCVVFDTVIEDMPRGSYPDRPWCKGDNPMTAVRSYLKKHHEFQIQKQIQNKLLITVAPNGYLKKIK